MGGSLGKVVREKGKPVVGALEWGEENYVWESRVAKVRIARTGDDAKWEDGLQLSVEHLEFKVDNCCCCLLSAWNHRHLQISTSLPLSLVLRQFGSTSKLSPSDWRALVQIRMIRLKPLMARIRKQMMMICLKPPCLLADGSPPVPTARSTWNSRLGMLS